MIVDIRKHSSDFLVSELVVASVIKKKWWGKRIDNYWQFLDEHTDKINVEFDAHLLTDLFAYLFDQLQFKELLEQYSGKLSKNRGSFVLVLVLEDRERLLPMLSADSFLPGLITYAKELNGEFYNYTDQQFEDTLIKFRPIVEIINDSTGMLINIG